MYLCVSNLSRFYLIDLNVRLLYILADFALFENRNNSSSSGINVTYFHASLVCDCVCVCAIVPLVLSS